MFGTRLGTCLTQRWDNADKGRDVTVVPGRENSINSIQFNSVQSHLGHSPSSGHRSTAWGQHYPAVLVAQTLWQCRATQAAVGRGGSWNPSLLPPEAFLVSYLLSWELLTRTDLCPSHCPHTQYFVTAPKITNWLDLADLSPRGSQGGETCHPRWMFGPGTHSWLTKAAG